MRRKGLRPLDPLFQNRVLSRVTINVLYKNAGQTPGIFHLKITPYFFFLRRTPHLSLISSSIFLLA